MVATRPVSAGAGRSPLLRAYVGLAHAVTFFIFVQALLAGRWASSGTMPGLHELVANFLFLLGAALVVVAFFARRQDAGAPSFILWFSLALLVLIVAQIGLGYTARDNPDMRAWHLPLGVLLFGVGVANSVAVSRLIRR